MKKINQSDVEFWKGCVERNRESYNCQKKQLELNLQRLAETACPYEIDDRIIIRGYTHTGKIGIIDKIKPVNIYSSDRSLWCVEGIVLKKDDTPSKFRFETSEYFYRRSLAGIK